MPSARQRACGVGYKRVNALDVAQLLDLGEGDRNEAGVDAKYFNEEHSKHNKVSYEHDG